MNIRAKLYIQEKKKELIRKWYKAMKPLANYLSKRDDEKYLKMKQRITKDQAIKWTGNAIINDVIHYPKEPFRLMIAERKDDEYHSDSYCMGTYQFRHLLKKDKHRTAFNKFYNGIEFQEEVVRYIKSKSGITVTEIAEEFLHTKPEDYKKTYIIKVEQ